MKEWEQLEQLMTGEERQRLFEWIKQQLLISAVKGGETPGAELWEAMGWQDNCYQVVYSRSFDSGQTEAHYQLKELLFWGMHENLLSFSFQEGESEILVLRGQAAVARLNIFIEHYLTTPPQKNSPMYSLFFTCGRVVNGPEGLHESYQTAVELMQHRFFSGREQHMLDEKGLEELRQKEGIPLCESDITQFCEALVDSIQTFNKSFLGKQMELLRTRLLNSHETEQKVRVFLAELYIQTCGKLREKYHVTENSTAMTQTVLESIYSQDYLYEIMDRFTRSLEMMMHAIGGPSRDSVLNDILFYIQHNIGEPLKLERIAPLFGYNSAYLGKIFRQNVGESFNTYVDRVRIERAMELLKQDQLKVYEISERVGYKSVDYFHKKFLKYVDMSPAAYRRMMNGRKA